jgi:hypothetical protein
VVDLLVEECKGIVIFRNCKIIRLCVRASSMLFIKIRSRSFAIVHTQSDDNQLIVYVARRPGAAGSIVNVLVYNVLGFSALNVDDSGTRANVRIKVFHQRLLYL